MASTKTIFDYSAATTVDGVQDYLLIEQAGTFSYRKVNRTVFLGITGTPVGTVDSQTLTNKTLSAPILSSPILQGTVTGTYTLAGTPTFPSSVTTITGTQTLTNKTLTAPIISGGSIDNATITVDSISGHTSPTIVTVGGVQMNNGVIGTLGAVNTNAIVAGAITPNTLLAGTGTGWSWQNFNPSFSNFVPGNGTLLAQYVQIGKLVMVYINFTGGSSSSLTGIAGFAPPVAANSIYNSSGNNIVGHGFMYTGAGGSNVGLIAAPFMQTNALINFGFFSPSATNNALANSSSTTWGSTGLIISINAIYQAA